MIRLSQLALFAAGAMFLAQAAMAAPPTLIDAFNAGRACSIHRDNPEVVWLQTVGSVNGERHEQLADELSVALHTLQDMMEESGTGREDILELRISTTSEAYSRQVSLLIDASPELAGIPFTYRVVDGFTVRWARVGIDAVLQNPKAKGVIAAKYGSNVGSRCL